jgi:diaminopimelate epimerase
MRVWERGSGEILACGTGACASLATASLNGLSPQKLKVVLRGGELFIDWQDDNCVYMTGPAKVVFTGEVEL